MRKMITGVMSLLFLLVSALAVAAPVDVNTADAATLAKSLKGVGAKKAEAIVAYRKEHGPFHTVDELAKVKGVSAKTIEENRSNLSVGKH